MLPKNIGLELSAFLCISCTEGNYLEVLEYLYHF